MEILTDTLGIISAEVLMITTAIVEAGMIQRTTIMTTTMVATTMMTEVGVIVV